ncbi:MAG: hypothetical protein JW794_09565 [Candidatus Cloacimonetes bacterium]|nr:hypothetical protein [Candidatus Cloacimonadota bacterium]
MKRILLVSFVLIAVLVSCSWWNKDKDKNMDDLDFDPAFTFNTTRMVTFDITGPVNTDINIFLEYHGEGKSPKDTLLLDRMVVSTMTDSIGMFEDIISLPSYRSHVYLQSGEYIEKFDITKTSTTKGEVISLFMPPKNYAGS